jgi:hypothetical protein
MFVRATPKHGAEEVAVVHAMQSHRFDFAGASRSYLAKHEGLATLLPGGDLMFRRYASFRQQLPAACTDAGLSLKEVEFTTYCRLLDQWLRKNSDWKP